MYGWWVLYYQDSHRKRKWTGNNCTFLLTYSIEILIFCLFEMLSFKLIRKILVRAYLWPHSHAPFFFSLLRFGYFVEEFFSIMIHALVNSFSLNSLWRGSIIQHPLYSLSGMLSFWNWVQTMFNLFYLSCSTYWLCVGIQYFLIMIGFELY